MKMLSNWSVVMAAQLSKFIRKCCIQKTDEFYVCKLYHNKPVLKNILQKSRENTSKRYLGFNTATNH